ncbi:MAG TPA: hypothetical protein VFP61_11830, partial [Acidimicrobiales bacterium]|nr:hypothetical protein [Acidimicrobiales bacterium]
EMAVAGGVGVVVDEGAVADHGGLFGEGPSRVLACVAPDRVAAVEALVAATASDLEVTAIATAGGDRIVVPGLVDVAVADAAAAGRAVLEGHLGLGGGAG